MIIEIIINLIIEVTFVNRTDKSNKYFKSPCNISAWKLKFPIKYFCKKNWIIGKVKIITKINNFSFRINFEKYKIDKLNIIK